MSCRNLSRKSFMSAAIFTLLCVLSGWQATLAQKPQTEIFIETLAQADAKMQAKQWTEAAALWEKEAKTDR